MTNAIFNEAPEASVQNQTEPKVVDLLHQPLTSSKNRDVSQAVPNQDVRYTEPPHDVKENEQIEDLEIQAEESIQTGPIADHLRPSVVHRKLQPMLDGKLHGVVEAHDQEGKLLSHHNYENGILQGEARKYDTRQRIRDRVNYLNGVPHGPAEFYQNGRAVMHTHYEYGEMHGETTYYDPNSGMVKARVNHQSGKKNGTAITYDALGKPQRILHYVDNELEGPAFSYNNEGGVLQEGYYLRGQKHGQFTSYYKNGEKRKVEFYENGRLTRRPILFTPDGDEYEPQY